MLNVHAFHLFFCFFFDGNSLGTLREYEYRYPDRRQPNRRVLERVHRNLRETVTVVAHATHQPALVIFLLQQDDFLREQHGVQCMRMSCIRFIYNQYKGCTSGQTSPSTVFSISVIQSMYAFRFLCCGKD
jgi:hypothetical protein